jgi:Zn-dependent protease with chaperone function
MPLLLAAYVVAVAAAGTWWLPRASWPLRAPRLGIAVWLALTVTVVASALLAGLILAVPCLRVWADWASLKACMMSVRAQYASAGGAAASTAGGALTLAAAARLAWFTGSALAVARCRRARHDEVLALVGRRGPVPGALLLDDDRPAVYCLPGRRRIVFTTGAVRRLDNRQLGAVLAHERAHLAGRHHLVLLLAGAPRGAFPHLRFFAVAASQIGCLVEMAADDAAARRTHPLTLAGALLTLAAVRVPAGALGAAGTAGAQRIRRLIDSPRQASRGRRAAASALALIAAPAVAFSAPSLALIAISHCPPSAAHSHLVISAPGTNLTQIQSRGPAGHPISLSLARSGAGLVRS